MEKELLENLIDNAFDFLETGISKFKESPKYSVINFCAAIELLLKARLMSEHWSLIVATKNHPDLSKFQKGDFKSINFKDLLPRIEAVTNETFSKETVDCFNGLANHRNKMIHFFHEAHAARPSDELLEQIAIEQCNGWFYLQRLLRKWNKIFGSYSERITSINQMMKVHRVYLEAVFERIKPELDAEKKQGTIFKSCSTCGYDSNQEYRLTDLLFEYKCRVCTAYTEVIKLPCPNECSGDILLEQGQTIYYCNECDQETDYEYISEKLDDKKSVSPDDYIDYVQKNCAACNGLGTVNEHSDDYYICTACFYFSKGIEYCGWCNEGEIGGGSLESSHYTGCEFCDGQAGWIKDD